MQVFDVLVIGGGICGMTAAIYAARNNLNVCILEEEICGGLVNFTHSVENMPSYFQVNGMALMTKCREQAESLGVKIFEIEGAVHVDFESTPKKILTSDDETFSAPAVIIATGRKPFPFPVQTDFERVHYCSVCDGTNYIGKDIVVLGGGNSGFDESLYLAGLGVNSIHIVEFFDICAADKTVQKQADDTGKIKVSVSSSIVSVEKKVSGKGLVTIKNNQTGESASCLVDGIFCFIGQKPNSGLFEGILAMDNNYIQTNENMETNIPGVFAAGDVRVKKYRQITTAMNDGTIAALEAYRYLRR